MELILVAAAAFLVTTLAIPGTILLAKRFKLVDDPKLRPHPAHIQHRVVPRAGGLAIYFGILAAMLFFLPIEKQLLGIILGMTVLLLTGIIDDMTPSFNPYTRLALLFLAAGIAVGSGIGISFITNPLTVFQNMPLLLSDSVIHLDGIVIPFQFFGPHKLILLADLFALFWIVILTQVVNWSKGVDGQMPGITAVASLVLGFLSLKLFYQGDPNQLNIAKLAFITTGVSLAFLVFNWHPAKIFPGFSGSTILAFMLAVVSILSGAKIATALLVLAIPAADFVYTILRRVSKGKSPVWGDRGHLHHRLLDLGWSHQQISLFYILGSAMLGATALLANTEGKVLAVVLATVAFLGFVLWVSKASLRVNSSGGLSKQPGPGNG